MPSRSELDLLYQIGSQLAPAIHQAQNWPYDVPHAQYEASLWPPHDVGGQPDAPVRYEEKEEEQWELDTYVTCEVLGWKGVWNAEERRRRGNNDIGLSLYYDFPYYGRWVLCAARMLVDKNHVSLLELLEKIAEVKARYGKPYDRQRARPLQCRRLGSRKRSAEPVLQPHPDVRSRRARDDRRSHLRRPSPRR